MKADQLAKSRLRARDAASFSVHVTEWTLGLSLWHLPRPGGSHFHLSGLPSTCSVIQPHPHRASGGRPTGRVPEGKLPESLPYQPFSLVFHGQHQNEATVTSSKNTGYGALTLRLCLGPVECMNTQCEHTAEIHSGNTV